MIGHLSYVWSVHLMIVIFHELLLDSMHESGASDLVPIRNSTIHHDVFIVLFFLHDIPSLLLYCDHIEFECLFDLLEDLLIKAVKLHISQIDKILLESIEDLRCLESAISLLILITLLSTFGLLSNWSKLFQGICGKGVLKGLKG
jgi:hypothetical protein